MSFSAPWFMFALLVTAATGFWLQQGSTAGRSVWVGWFGVGYMQALVLAVGFLLSLDVGSRWVGLLVEPFARQLPDRPDRSPRGEDDRSDAPVRGFPEGGRVIGLLERALIFILVLAGELGAVGFLVAAKSVFRFGELRERANRVEAEYILIGTLASFLWGLTVAYLTRLLLGEIA